MFDCIRPRSISKFHDYISYKTIFGNIKWYCLRCNSKLNEEGYVKYQQAKKDWYEELYKNAPKIDI